MAKSKSTRAALDKGFQQIDRDLLLCRATLQCAAEALGISRMTLYRKLQKYGLLGPIVSPAVAGIQPRCRS